MNTGNSNIAQLFWEAAERYPDHIAIIENDQAVTYRQLQKEVRDTAKALKEQGLQPGDRILVFVKMSSDLYRIVLALFYAGATAVFLDEWVSSSRLERCCQLVDCKGYIAKGKIRLLTFFSKPIRNLELGLKDKQTPSNEAIATVDATKTALITFTTGSTGTPKAADRTHGFLKAQFEALQKEVHTQPRDIDMPMLPIVLFLNLGVGATSILANFSSRKPKKFNPRDILDQLNKHKATRLIGSPYFLLEIAKYLKQTGHASPQQLKNIYTGGAPVFPHQSKLLQEAFSSSTSHIVYGSTEAEPISLVNVSEQNSDCTEGLHVGQVSESTECMILPLRIDSASISSEEELKATFLSDGQIGEIFVAGEHVLPHYINNPEAEKEHKLWIGQKVWHRTGDSGFLKSGNLFLTGRCQQLIQTKSGIISPFLVENQLQMLPKISMGTILMLDDQLTVVAETSLPQRELKNLLAISGIHFDQCIALKDLPKDPRHFSKIDYNLLEKKLKRR